MQWTFWFIFRWTQTMEIDRMKSLLLRHVSVTKQLVQWKRSFHMNTALSLAERRATTSCHCINICPITQYTEIKNRRDGSVGYQNYNYNIRCYQWRQSWHLDNTPFRYLNLRTLTSSILCVQHEACRTVTDSGIHTIDILGYLTEPTAAHFVGTSWNETQNDDVMAS